MRRVTLDVKDLTVAGAAMLGAAAVLPLLPGDVGFACPLRTLTGIPCPLCGMTTSVEHVVRLELGDALAANPAGVVAVLVAVFLLLARPRRLAVPAIALSGALVTMWLFELNRFSII